MLHCERAASTTDSFRFHVLHEFNDFLRHSTGHDLNRTWTDVTRGYTACTWIYRLDFLSTVVHWRAPRLGSRDGLLELGSSVNLLDENLHLRPCFAGVNRDADQELREEFIALCTESGGAGWCDTVGGRVLRLDTNPPELHHSTGEPGPDMLPSADQ